MSAMWRSDDASRCVSASTVGDDVTSCDELARAKLGESPNVMRNVRDHRCGLGLPTLNQPRMLGLGWGNLPTGWNFVFWD